MSLGFTFKAPASLSSLIMRNGAKEEGGGRAEPLQSRNMGTAAATTTHG